jgi:hypothetical protein
MSLGEFFYRCFTRASRKDKGNTSRHPRLHAHESQSPGSDEIGETRPHDWQSTGGVLFASLAMGLALAQFLRPTQTTQ